MCSFSFILFLSQLQYLNITQSSFPLSVLLTSVPSTSSITEQSYPRLEKRQKVRISNANRSFDCRGEEHLVQCYSMIYWFRCREVIGVFFSVSPRFEEKEERYFFTTVMTQRSKGVFYSNVFYNFVNFVIKKCFVTLPI